MNKASTKLLENRRQLSRNQAVGFVATMSIVGIVVVWSIFASGTPIAFEAESGTFYYQEDLANQTGRIYIGTDPAMQTIELAKRPVALVLGNHQVYNLKGIGFRRYASNEQANLTVGAVYDSGNGGLIENVSMIQNAGQALAVAPAGMTVHRSVLAFNGFNGMGSNGHSQGTGTYTLDNLTMDSIIVNNNNLKHFGLHCTLSCATSGVKIAHMNGYSVKNSLFENTQSTGDGFWCDEACQNGVMVNNVIRGNGGSGISYQVSTTGIVASNLIYNNGTGISFGSGNSSIVNNTLIDLWLYDDARNAEDLRGSNIGPDTRDMVVENNIFSSGASGPITIFKVNRSSEAQASDPNNDNTGPNTPGFFTNLDYNTYYRINGGGGTLVNWVDNTTGTDAGVTT
ncbi:right-handed parallel beta-helix repeat-containing protein [Candidatus Saccharibacteria bacterium]|nr:right-handed parallel beta-helix repeat-containing protein [Candidatus Saccharibacteria bacterium]